MFWWCLLLQQGGVILDSMLVGRSWLYMIASTKRRTPSIIAIKPPHTPSTIT